MSRENEKPSECTMIETDSEGRSNLCCCYIIDEAGRYDDPCYHPVDECCPDG
jgi:hypothetical protein